MPSYCDDIVDDNITEISNDSHESQMVDVESSLGHSLLSSSTIQTETCELIPNDHLTHLNDKDSHRHSLTCDKKPINSLTSSSSSTNSSPSSVLNYTIENLLSSSRKLSKPSSPPATAILQSTITGTAYITYPAYYDYRRLLPYSNVEQVWKYILPHHPNHNGHHNGNNNIGPISQNRGPRRQRTTFTHEQTLRLEMEYHVCDYISRGKRFQLADILDLTENQIKIWFQNRRAKDKRIEKAIMEQQYRQITASNIPKQVNLSNCSTCSYTKHQFESSMVTNGPAQPVDCDGKKSSLVMVKHKLKIESSTDQ